MAEFRAVTQADGRAFFTQATGNALPAGPYLIDPVPPAGFGDVNDVPVNIVAGSLSNITIMLDPLTGELIVTVKRSDGTQQVLTGVEVIVRDAPAVP